MYMKHKFLVLWLAGLVGAAAVLPYAFTLQHDIIATVGKPLPLLVFASIAQTAVLLAVAIFFGLKFAKRVGLSVLEAGLLAKGKLRGFLTLTVGAGIVTAVLIAVGDNIFGRYLPELARVNGSVALWKTLLASLYGGIVEELLMRLLCMSLFTWVLAKVFRSPEPAKNAVLMWTAMGLSAVLFGLGHLPITSALMVITPLVVVRAIVLNGIGGLVFGWLYWKKGLEYSMAAHFTADIVLLAILPALLK